ncbi:MAG: type II CAAX endopeptidase family protein [Bacilli bacterium]
MKEKKFLPIIGLSVVLLYFIFNTFQIIPLSLMGIDYNNMRLISKVCYLLGTELLFIIILFLIYKKKLTKDFKDYISNFKPYMKKYMEYWALAFGLMIISNILIITIFPNSISANQETINSIFKTAPLYMIFSAVIFAPFVEEIVFRLSFKNIFKNNTLFIILSGLVFGLLHVVGNFNNWIDLIYIIPYSIPGIVFAYTLVKSKNIFIPISLHLFHNGFMMLLQTILMFLI